MAITIIGRKGRNVLLASLLFILAIPIILLFSINARAVGIPTVTIAIDQYNPTCVLINATYNDTVTVPSSAGCGAVTCGTDLACCNPKLTDAGNRAYNLSSTTITNGGKTYLSRHCGLSEGIYDYNISGFYIDGLTGRGGITFQMVAQDPALCGNRVINVGEECDDGNKVDGDGCDRICRQERCNNGRIDSGEECDGNNLANQNCNSLYPTSHCGNLACNPSTCQFIGTGCGCWEPNFCGDGTVDPSRGEQCDFGPGVFTIPATTMRCSDINSEFSGGYLVCRNCTINTTFCQGAPIGGFCTDHNVEAGEQCEDSDLDGKSCATFNFTGGPLTCNSAKCLFNVSQCTRIDPYCGDGMISPPDEVCDGVNLGNNNYCSDLGMCGTTLACDPDDCHYDTSACYDCPDLCGVSPFDIDPNEECDGTNLPSGASCPYGYEGIVGCDIDCNLDYTGCYPISNPCGNGQLDPGEQCEYLPIRNTILCSQINPSLSGVTRLSCTNNCTYNTSSCIGNSGGHCGNPFIIERGEQCEGTNTYGRACTTFNFTNGTLSCNPSTCQFNTSMCNNPPPWCGDGKKNVVGESCDETDLGGLACHNYTSPPQFGGGTLGCAGDCDYDTSACEPIPDPTCNNGQMNSGEECDGNILNGQVCPYGGSISCTRNCQFNYSACNPPPPNHCGDGKVDPCEECDEGPNGGDVNLPCSELNSAFTPNRGRLRCNGRGIPNQCMFNTSLCWGGLGGICGDPLDPTVVPGEQCEGSNLDGKSCSDFGTFTTGSLTCNASTCTFNTCHCGGAPPYCGDNSKNNVSESCDDPDLDDQTCESRGFASGILDCLPNCHFDTTRCIPFPPLCGNGAIDSDDGEECDGNLLNNMDCGRLGFLPSNDLFCNPPETSNQCKYNTSDCTPPADWCGDGIVQTGEQCEPRNQDIPTGAGNVTCRNISTSFTGGTLKCNSRCMLNTSLCTGPTSARCGLPDTTVGRGEQCEGTNASGRTCRMINPDFFTGGDLSCTSCILNTSDCITDSYCDDGRRDVPLGERCDGNDLGGLKCSNFSEYVGGALGCYGSNAGNNACTFNFDLCTPIVNPDCGNEVINSGETCDGDVMPDISCPWTGTVSCADNCTIDYSDCDPPPNYCGDGNLQPGEQCEPPNSIIPYNTTSVKCRNISDSFSAAAPIGNNNALRCGSRCLYNTSLCIGPTSYSCGGENPITVGRGEQCEGTDIDGRTCSMINPYFTAGTLSCTNCMYNTSRCESPDPVCGDNIIQKPNSDGKIEECDRANLGGYTCDDFEGLEGGILACDNCNFDTNSCGDEPTCGDGIIQPQNGEICEPTDLNGMDCDYLGFDGGTLGCSATTCWFDPSQCNLPNVYCGNGMVESCEQCDSGINSQTSSISCPSFGFGTGTITCTKNCTINTTSCSGGALLGSCSNGVLNRGEQCDQTLREGVRCANFSTAFISGGVSCNVSKCTSNTCECVTGERGPYCGDNVTNINLDEECDGSDLLGKTCQTLGYASGNLKCSRLCVLNISGCVPGSYCGDGAIQKPNFAGFVEDCEGANVAGRTCALEYGSRSTGKVNCTGTCLFDYSNCTNIPLPICGDNRRDAIRGEDCDDEDFDGQTCVTQGYDLGTLMCNDPDEANPCEFDKSDCKNDDDYCGDMIIERGEQCDGSIGTVTCADFGFTAGHGYLTCSGCMYDTSHCVGTNGGWCGNTGNVLNVGEQCDATIKGDIACRDFGFMDGALSCENCLINTNGCNPVPDEGYCGDGAVQHPNSADMDEQCDLTNVEGNTCVSRGYYRGTLRCLGDCSFDYSNCSGPPATCGDGRRNLELGEDCDLTDLGVETCESLAYIGGELTCNSTCGYNKSNCQEDPNRPHCGDSQVSKPNAREFMEDCDGGNLDGMSCLSFPDAYDGGILSCDGDCTFDYTRCVPKNDFCGNYIIDPCEDCDMGDNGGIIPLNVMRCSEISNSFTSGTLRCTSGCKFNTSSCDGIGGGICSGISGPNTFVNEGESCDGGVGNLGCTNISSDFNGGALTCNPLTCQFNTCDCTVGEPLPVCGDGVPNQNSEECDKLNLKGETCMSLGYQSGILKCTDGCILNKTGCVPFPVTRCGDNIIQHPNSAGFNESCDTNTMGGYTCDDFDIYDRGILRCLGDCNFDYSNCSGPVSPRCGDGIRHTALGEDCDNNDRGGSTCRSLGYNTGILSCNGTCGFDKSNCIPYPEQTYCGDSIIQDPNSAGFNEDCDGSNLNDIACTNLDRFGGGDLACSGDCTFNTLDCWTIINRCGNGVVGPGEQCEGTSVNMTCVDMGFNGGTLSCKNCIYNTSSCTGDSDGYCGDGELVKGEQCDEGPNGGSVSLACSEVNSAFNGGTLRCNSSCVLDTSSCTVGPQPPVCGDGARNKDDEECDAFDLGGKTCQSLGYLHGTLKCYASGTANQCRLNTSGCIPSPDPYCGDDIIQTPNVAGFNEQCEGTHLNSRTCTNFADSPYTGGALHCHTDCSYDYSGCTHITPASCGDSAKNRLVEDCDQDDLGGSSCQSLGYHTGTLACTDECKFDRSSCTSLPNFCGNRIIDAGEQCDGGVGGMTCDDFGFTPSSQGVLSCSNKCMYNTSKCIGTANGSCGDSILEVGEQCDGAINDLGCTSFGFMSGNLECTGCAINTSNCISAPSRGYCGDSVVQQLNGANINESCDGANINGKHCPDFDSYTSGALQCLGDCSYDYSNCNNTIIVGTSCGDDVVQQPNSHGFTEDCDGNDLNGRSCVFLGYVSGTLNCADNCRFDKSDCSYTPRTYCGDNIIQKPNSAGLNELCEGSNVNNRICSQFDSYLRGDLACHGDCSFNYDNCNGTALPRCGDGAKNQYTEECDIADFGVETCLSLGYINGSLSCTTGTANGCKLVKSGCTPPLNLCGDRIIQPGEQCDGNLGNVSCRSFGFIAGGYVSCQNCIYNTSDCFGGSGGYCGDPAVVPGEQCEASVSSSVSCRTFGLWDGTDGTDGTVRCVNCKYNTSDCIAPDSQGYCGDGGVQKPNWVGTNEDCDGGNLNGMRCADVGNYNTGTLKCNGDCSFDYSNCSITRVISSCGDGSIQAPNSAGFNEQCDGTNLNNKICSSFSNYTSGSLRCSGDCSFDYYSCTGIIPKCGDGVKNLLSEECDGADFGSQSCEALGYASGTLSCTGSCKLNKAGCVSGPKTYCGDSIVQQPNGVGFLEQCDASSLNGKTCQSFSGYSGGTLACRGDCSYDYSGCDNIATLRCGDNVRNRIVEDCDGTSDLAGHTCVSQGYLGGILSCTGGCKFDKSRCSSTPSNSCGDSVVQQPNGVNFLEECDNADFNGETCQSLGYRSGTLKCTGCKLDKTGCVAINTSTAVCGDSTVQAPNRANFFEQCDGSNLNSLACSLFDSYTGGNLGCYGDCTRDYRGCTGGTFNCGDGVKNNVTEECDSTDLGGQSCQTLGYLSGTLGCTSNCKLIKSGCEAAPSAYCGDGTIQSPNGVSFNEQCDRNNLNGNSCDDFGYYTDGTLDCHTDCSYDYSDCTGGAAICGDGAKNQDVEECDNSDFGGLTCAYLGYASGSLKCSFGCKLDKSSCIKGNRTYCGDNDVQKPNAVGFNEQCDSTNLKGKNCTDFDYAGGKLSCAGDCTFSYSNCTTATKGLCGDGVKNGMELCDKNDWGFITGCISFSSFKGGTLSCSQDSCHFNTTKCVSLNSTLLPVNASCYDNEKDGDESDLDCGGSCFPCADGKVCMQSTDCVSNNCKNNVCEGASCEDGIRNGIETDSDCGGNCPQCNVGQGCSIDNDCLSTFCNLDTLLCALPDCNDGFLNGDESDLDCGGGCDVKCSVGLKCRASYDCQSGSCEAGLCSQDRNLDTDGDGMNDWWEDKYGLNKNDASDANEDLDGDGYTNLQEFNLQSDPTDANSPQTPGAFRNHTLQIILLIIGILFMAGSAGFLIYSRKVLIPQQKIAAQKKIILPPGAQRPLFKQPLSRPAQTSQSGKPQLPREKTSPGRFAKKEGERKSLLSGLGFGKEKTEEKAESKAGEKPGEAILLKPETKSGAGAKSEIKGKPSAETDKSDDFINLSELGKAAEKKEGSGQAKTDKKPSGDVFKRLRELIASRKKK